MLKNNDRLEIGTSRKSVTRRGVNGSVSKKKERSSIGWPRPKSPHEGCQARVGNIISFHDPEICFFCHYQGRETIRLRECGPEVERFNLSQNETGITRRSRQF
jgi:hypothetical protein